MITCEVRTRKMCVFARTGRYGVYTPRRVHGSCHCLCAKLPEKRQLQLRSAFGSVVPMKPSVKKTTLSRSRQTVSSGHSEREFDFVFSYHWSDHLLSCHPCECHFCQLWCEEDEIHLVGLGDQLEDDDVCGRSEFCGSAKCSAQ